jgi:hypothetical protein
MAVFIEGQKNISSKNNAADDVFAETKRGGRAQTVGGMENTCCGGKS